MRIIKNKILKKGLNWSIKNEKKKGAIIQSVECAAHNGKVRGSSPLGPIYIYIYIYALWCNG